MKHYLKLLISVVLVINCSSKTSLNNIQTINDIPGNWISPYLSMILVTSIGGECLMIPN